MASFLSAKRGLHNSSFVHPQTEYRIGYSIFGSKGFFILEAKEMLKGKL